MNDWMDEMDVLM